MLVDGRGVPLSLVVTGANRHDVSQLAAVLDAIMVERPSPPIRRHKDLCADAGYTGAPALKVIELDRSFLALNHWAASIIAFRKLNWSKTLFTDKFLII